MHYYLEKAPLYSVGNRPSKFSKIKENQFHGNLICNVTETEVVPTSNHRNKNKYHFSK